MYITLIGLKQRGRENERKVVILRVKILPKSHDFFVSLCQTLIKRAHKKINIRNMQIPYYSFLINKKFNEHRTYVKAMKICVYTID